MSSAVLVNTVSPLRRGLTSRERAGSLRNDFGRRKDDCLEIGGVFSVGGESVACGERVNASGVSRRGLVGGDWVTGMFIKSPEVVDIPVTWRMKEAIARKQYLAGVVKEKRMGSI